MSFLFLSKTNSFLTSNKNFIKASANLKVINHQHVLKIAFTAFIRDQVYSNTRVPTRVNTNQHESTRVQHESIRVNTNQHESDTSPTRVNTSPTRVNTNQHDSNTSQHEATRVQNRSRPWKRDKHGSKKRQNLTERCCGRLHLSGFRFLLKIYDQLNY